MTEFRATAAGISDRAGVPPELVAALLMAVVQLVQACYSDPARAAAWMRQDTPATRGIIRRRVRRAARRQGIDPVTIPALAEVVADEARQVSDRRMARMYAEAV